MKQECPPSAGDDSAPAWNAADTPLLSVRQLGRAFPAGEGTVAVLQDIDLDIRAGEMVAIVGQSGSGKSTLMNILGCLDRPTSGSYRVAGRETHALDADALAAPHCSPGWAWKTAWSTARASSRAGNSSACRSRVRS